MRTVQWRWAVLGCGLVLFLSGQAKAQNVVNTAAGTGLRPTTRQQLDRDMGDSGQATAGTLFFPRGVTTDAAGNIYIADSQNARIRKVDAATGVITTVAGNGNLNPTNPPRIDDDVAPFAADDDPSTGPLTGAIKGPIGFARDGRKEDASIGRPSFVAVQASTGDIYFSESTNNRVLRVEVATGLLHVAAGFENRSGPTAQDLLNNPNASLTGDNGPATIAYVVDPRGIALDASGNLYIAEAGRSRVRRVDSSGVITTYVGTEFAGEATPSGFSGDGGPANLAKLSTPTGLALDAAGNLYIADSGNNRIRRVDAATQIITTVAGNGVAGFSGDGGAGTAAMLNFPKGLVADSASGSLLIADFLNHRIRSLNVGSGVITTVVGGGTLGDGAAPTSTVLVRPNDVGVDGSGNVLIAEAPSHSIRQCGSGSVTNVDTDGDGFSDNIETAAGTSISDASDTPFAGLPPQADVPVINRLKIRLKFG